MFELKIDPEFRDVLPQSAEGYQKLEKAVLEDGYFTDPFITWNGYIIDGHTRYQIMKNHPELDLKPYEKKMDDKLEDRYAVIVWIATHQESRRNLNDFEWAEIHKKAYDAQKKSIGAPTGNRNAEKQLFESDQLISKAIQTHAGTTATVLSKEFGKTPSQFKHSVRTGQAMDEAERIVPGFKKALKDGTIKTSKDRVESLLDIKDEDERKAYVMAIVSGDKKLPPKRSPAIKPVREDKRKGWTREDRELAERIRQNIENENQDFEYTIDNLIVEIQRNADNYVSSLRKTLEVRSTLLVGENRPKTAEAIEYIIQRITKIKELLV